MIHPAPRRIVVSLACAAAAVLVVGCGSATVPVLPQSPGATGAAAPADGPDTVEVGGVPVQVPPGLVLPASAVVDVATPGMVVFSAPTGEEGLAQFTDAFDSAGYAIENHTGVSFLFASGAGADRWSGTVISDGSGIVLTYRQGEPDQTTPEPSSTATPDRIEADGRTVQVPPGFQLPAEVTIAEQGDSFLTITSPRGEEALTFYRRMLPSAGYTIDGDNGWKLSFSNADWYGEVAVFSEELQITFDRN